MRNKIVCMKCNTRLWNGPSLNLVMDLSRNVTRGRKFFCEAMDSFVWPKILSQGHKVFWEATYSFVRPSSFSYDREFFREDASSYIGPWKRKATQDNKMLCDEKQCKAMLTRANWKWIANTKRIIANGLKY